MVCNNINCGLWVTYGLVIKDPYLYTPMGISLLFGVVQIIMCVIFPKTKAWQKMINDDNQMLEFKGRRLSMKYIPQSQWGGFDLSNLAELEGSQAEENEDDEDDNRKTKMVVLEDEGHA